MALNLSGAYYNHALGLISLSNGDGNWITIADKNLGATNTTFGDEGNCGKLFQRGNCYGFTADYANNKITGYSSTTTSIPAHTGGPGSYNSSVLIYSNSGLADNRDLWGGVTGTYEAMRGPCDEGWHIPTLTEWGTFGELAKQSPYTETETRDAMALNGVRYRTADAISNDTLPAIGSGVVVWLSTVSGSTLGGDYGSNFSAVSSMNYGVRSMSLLPIRPFKNVPVEPDSTWDKIYGDDIPEPKSVKKIKKIMNNGQEYRIDAVPEGGNVGEVLIKEGDGEKWGSVDVGVVGSGVRNMKVLTKTAFNNLTKKEDDVMYLIGPQATDINITTTSLSFNKIGQQKQIVASVVPDTAVAKGLLYESQNINIVTVDENGLVTCVGTGSTTITIKTEELTISKTINITVDTTNYINVLLVGGGAGGNSVGCCYRYCSHPELWTESSGGGGGVVECKNYAIPVGSYSVNIGCGGAGGAPYSTTRGGGGAAGGTTTFRSLSAAGGSGSTSGNGNKSGSSIGYTGAGYMASHGGAGGAGGAGCDGTSVSYSYYGGDGGPGVRSSIPGFQTYRGGGGGGAGTDRGGSGGYGGGGSGAAGGNNNGGSANWHGGGGGGASGSGCGGSGFSGFVGISYPTECGYDIEGGIKGTSGDYTYHCFRSSGTLTVR